MSKVPLRSQQAGEETDPKAAIELILSDLQAIAIEVGRKRILHLTGSERLVLPAAGVVRVYVVSSRATTSDGSNYNVINVTRNGQVETGVSLDTHLVEIGAYDERCLGVIQGSRGDVIALQVVTTGLPYPILSTANLTLRCELSPREIK